MFVCYEELVFSSSSSTTTGYKKKLLNVIGSGGKKGKLVKLTKKASLFFVAKFS